MGFADNLVDLASYLSDGYERNGNSYELVNRNTLLSRFATTYETFVNDFHSAAPKQSTKACEKFMVTMCPGMCHFYMYVSFF